MCLFCKHAAYRQIEKVAGVEEPRRPKEPTYSHVNMRSMTADSC
jgi:hypothetical protein